MIISVTKWSVTIIALTLLVAFWLASPAFESLWAIVGGFISAVGLIIIWLLNKNWDNVISRNTSTDEGEKEK